MRILLKEERAEFQKKFSYQQVGDFYEGLAVAEKDGQWFHIFENGTPVYTNRFDLAEFFQNGLAWAKKGNKWIRINMQGEEVAQKMTSS